MLAAAEPVEEFGTVVLHPPAKQARSSIIELRSIMVKLKRFVGMVLHILRASKSASKVIPLAVISYLSQPF